MIRAVLVLALAACGGEDRPYIDPDALTCCICISPECRDDAGPEEPDAEPPDGSLAEGSPCSPTMSECGAGLTCRYVGQADGVPQGECRPAGTAAVGDTCAMLADPACGPEMECVVINAALEQECRTLCAPSDPEPRCGALECWAYPQMGDDIGACETL